MCAPLRPAAQAGAALADVLFGEAAPSGRLPVTWHFNNYTELSYMPDMAMRPFPGRTHRYVQASGGGSSGSSSSSSSSRRSGASSINARAARVPRWLMGRRAGGSTHQGAARTTKAAAWSRKGKGHAKYILPVCCSLYCTVLYCLADTCCPGDGAGGRAVPIRPRPVLHLISVPAAARLAVQRRQQRRRQRWSRGSGRGGGRRSRALQGLAG